MRFIFLTLGFTPDLDGGGYRYATEVAELLASRGHEVHALFPEVDQSRPARERRAGVELHRLPRGTGGFFARWRRANHAARARVAELLAASDAPTLVFSHHAYFGPAARTFPFVAMVHGPWALEHRFTLQGRERSWPRRLLDEAACRLMHRVERRELRAAQHVLVTTEYMRRNLKRWHPGTGKDTEAIGGGADFQRFQPPADRTAVRAEFGLSGDEFLLLTVRRLDPRMGLTVLVEGFASLAGEFPKARLWLAGRGPQRETLEAQIQKLTPGDRARLLGFVPEEQLPRLYAAADLVLMPSLDLEGFGLVTAEALACGTPVAASRAGANVEVLTPLSPALLFDAGRAEAVGGFLRGVLAGGVALPAREVCAAHARRHFRWDRAADACERAHVRFAVRPKRGGGP